MSCLQEQHGIPPGAFDRSRLLPRRRAGRDRARQDQPAAGDCLTPPQLATLENLRDGLHLPYTLAWNVDRYRGYNVFQGTRLTSMLGLAHSGERLPQPAFLPNGYLFAQGDAYIKYFVTHNPAFDSLNFDVMHPGRYQERLLTLSATIGAMNGDISPYIAHGGKLIALQGLADEVISPNQTIAYYKGLVQWIALPAGEHAVGCWRPQAIDRQTIRAEDRVFDR